MSTLKVFQNAYVEFLTTYRAQLLSRGAVGLARHDKRTLAALLLGPFRELLPHDMLLLESILNCEEVTDLEVVSDRAEALYRARGQ